MRPIRFLTQRIVPFGLLALVFVTAFGCFITAPGSVATTPEKTSDVSAAAAFASAPAATPPANIASAPATAAVAPASATAAPATAVTAPKHAASKPAGIVVAQNTCVHSANGAIVCGAVAKPVDTGTASPFDRPGGAQPITLAPGPTAVRPLPRRTVHKVAHHLHAAKHVYRPPPPHEYAARPPREYATHPPRQYATRPPREYATHPTRQYATRPTRQVTRQEAREEARRLPAEHAGGIPADFERGVPARYRTVDWHRYQIAREQALLRGRRGTTARHYDVDRAPTPYTRRAPAVQLADLERRMHGLERELQVLRADRDNALRHAQHDVRRPVYRAPPPRYRERMPDYDREPQPAPRHIIQRHVDHDIIQRHVDRDRQLIND